MIGGDLLPEARRRSWVVNRRDINYLESGSQNQTFVRHYPHTLELEVRTAVAKIGEGLETLAVAARLASGGSWMEGAHLIGIRWRRLLGALGGTSRRLLEAGSLGVGCFEGGWKKGRGLAWQVATLMGPVTSSHERADYPRICPNKILHKVLMRKTQFCIRTHMKSLASPTKTQRPFSFSPTQQQPTQTLLPSNGFLPWPCLPPCDQYHWRRSPRHLVPA